MEKSKSLNHCIPSRPSSILVNQTVHTRVISYYYVLLMIRKHLLLMHYMRLLQMN